MKRFLLFLLLTGSTVTSGFSQEEEPTLEEETSEEEYVSTKEVGIDLNFSASTFGGTGGLGLKVGFIKKEKFIFGPCIRYQHSWQNFNGIKSGFSIYGGGAFAHIRLYNYFFLGTEIEFLSSPVQNVFLSANRTWVPTALIGGGFSHAFGPNFRLNGGIMYDIIDHINSPFRQGYFMKNNLGVPIPILYRIAFFFPL